jgi:hypothetical protein
LSYDNKQYGIILKFLLPWQQQINSQINIERFWNILIRKLKSRWSARWNN